MNREPRAYYNEIDPYAAEWIVELIAQGVLPIGDVDRRSIVDVQPSDLAGYRQCHFFAGIGVWAYALGLGGWPAERPVWTGSCPCQPFSGAGKRAGFADERHLWPEFFRLIQGCRPEIVFGEQVAGPDGLAWLDVVQADLEREDYATGAFDLCAAGFGSPQRRQRLYWLAECPRGTVAHAQSGQQRRLREPGAGHGSGKFQDRGHGSDGAGGNPWADAEWLEHRDGRYRPVKPGTHPLAYGTASTVGRLRAAGNAIVAQVAAEFIAAYLSIGESTDARLVLDDYDEAWPGEVV